MSSIQRVLPCFKYDYSLISLVDGIVLMFAQSRYGISLATHLSHNTLADTLKKVSFENQFRLHRKRLGSSNI